MKYFNLPVSVRRDYLGNGTLRPESCIGGLGGPETPSGTVTVEASAPCTPIGSLWRWQLTDQRWRTESIQFTHGGGRSRESKSLLVQTEGTGAADGTNQPQASPRAGDLIRAHQTGTCYHVTQPGPSGRGRAAADSRSPFDRQPPWTPDGDRGHAHPFRLRRPS